MKTAGLPAEVINALINPLSNIGTPVGIIAAAITKKRSDEEQEQAEKEVWKNALIPGRAAYNIAKRVGRGGFKEKEASIKQAYAAGFIKKASEYGLNTQQALALLQKAAKEMQRVHYNRGYDRVAD
jgi:hypothetical protein